jgi:hypothetical protein
MSSRSKALSKSSLKNIIRISIGDRKKKGRRRRRSSSSYTSQQQKQPQIVVVQPQTPLNPYKREEQVQLSALEKNLENTMKTKKAARTVASQTGISLPPLMSSSVPPLTPPQTPPQTPPPQRPPTSPLSGDDFGLYGLFLDPSDPPFGLGPPPQQATATVPLQPDTRLTNPPLSPGAMLMGRVGQLFGEMRDYVLQNTRYIPRRPSGQPVYRPATVRGWTVERNFNALQNLYNDVRRARLQERGGGALPLSSPPPPGPLDPRRQSGLFPPSSSP